MKYTPTFYALKHLEETHIKIDPSGTPYIFGSKEIAELWADRGYEVVRVKISIIK